MQNAANRILSDIHDLAPQLGARVAEFEAARRIPPDVVSTLRSIGVFRMFVPRSHDGLALDLPAAADIIAALARIDGSLGWIVMIASNASLCAPLLPRETYDDIYRHGPDVIFAGSTQPLGTLDATDSGWRVSGRWPFASGCQHADFIIGAGTRTERGKPLCEATSEGVPLPPVCFMLPAREWQIEDTWRVSGLRATGSHHIAIKDATAAATQIFTLAEIAPCVPGPLYGSLLQVASMLMSAVAVGIAEAALDDIIAYADTGRRQQYAPAPMRDSETFHGELGRAAVDVRAARAFFESENARYWRRALAGTHDAPAFHAEVKQGAIWLTATCIDATMACFALGGGSAIYDGSPLQRRLRDLQAVGQHAVVQRRHYADAGKMLLQQ